MPPPFEYSLRVRFHQADPAGVLFYGRVFELIQETYEHFCRSVGIDIDAAMRMEGITTPVVSARADFRKPMQVGETITVRVTCSRVGQSSYDLEYDLVGADGTLRAAAHVVHVVVSAADWLKVPIPDDLRRQLASHGSSVGTAG